MLGGPEGHDRKQVNNSQAIAVLTGPLPHEFYLPFSHPLPPLYLPFTPPPNCPDDLTDIRFP